MADVLIVNVKTGERIERDFTPEELEQREKDQAEAAAAEQAAIDKQAAKETAVKSGRAKLLALGLTNEEVEAMTNG